MYFPQLPSLPVYHTRILHGFQPHPTPPSTSAHVCSPFMYVESLCTLLNSALLLSEWSSLQCDFGQTLTLLNEPLCCHVLCNACLHLTCAGKHSPHLPSQFNTLHYKELSPAMPIEVWLVPAPVGVNTLTSLECFTSFYQSNLDHTVMLLCIVHLVCAQRVYVSVCGGTHCLTLGL